MANAGKKISKKYLQSSLSIRSFLIFFAVVFNQCIVCRLISELEERVELVSQEIASLEGVDRKATEISERYPYPICNQ
jgi:hypothetical protein